MKEEKTIKTIMKVIFTIIFAFLIITCIQNKAEAKSYSVENMDIQATVNQNGSLSISQEITYKFNR